VAAEGLVALGLSGELDIETVPIFEAAMERVLADAPATAVLEMHALSFSTRRASGQSWRRTNG